jgi:hypothetical protein
MPCDGTWRRNDDGLPEVVCGNFHLAGGVLNTSAFTCEQCKGRQKPYERTVCPYCESGFSLNFQTGKVECQCEKGS